MLAFLSWWLLIQLFGLAALPLTRRVFAWLPGRGYAFSKVVGLLLVSYLLWLGASLGILPNTLVGILVALLLVALISAWAGGVTAGDGWQRLRSFWRENRGQILTSEALFLLAFAGWALLRAYAPEKIMPASGEKYMEIAFLNGVLNSPSFPPLDPWFAGHTISYYYFGYVMMAVLVRLSGVAPSMGFDLYDALLFGLTAISAFGVVSSLVRSAGGSRRAGSGFGLLGALFVGGMGNLEGLLEGLYSSRAMPGSFWMWIDIPDLTNGMQTGSFYPGNSWWWWRASRVIRDLDLFYRPIGAQPIDEFPFFSFLLGDNHPHKLALPFVLMIIGLALNLFLRVQAGEPAGAPAAAGSSAAGRWYQTGWIKGRFFLFYALALGSLGFLNTWDLPIYLGLTLLAYAAGRYTAQERASVAASQVQVGDYQPEVGNNQPQVEDNQPQVDFRQPEIAETPAEAEVVELGAGSMAVKPLVTSPNDRRSGILGQALLLAAGLSAAAFLLYIFFYTRFSSQAGGALPYIFPPTRLPQYLVMFGVFVFILAGFAVLAARRANGGAFPLAAVLQNWLWIAVLSLGAYLALLLIGFGLISTESMRNNPVIQSYLNGEPASRVLARILDARLMDPWLFLALSALLALALTGLLLRAGEAGAEAQPELPPAARFSLLLVFTGLALTFVLEFIYLRDNFGTRMNTVFKFYFQAWVMLACASAFGVWWVSRAGRGLWRALFLLGSGLLVAAGLVYPLMSFYSRADGFSQTPNLDAGATLAGDYPGAWAAQPDDWAAIQWLRASYTGPMANGRLPDGSTPILLEASGRAYENAGRISAFTGFPTLLGWGDHEIQWRGSRSSAEIAQRAQLVATIYTTSSASLALDELQKAGVTYVIIGDTERAYVIKQCSEPGQTCSISQALNKFPQVLTPVFTQGGTTVYQVPQAAAR